MPTTKKLKRLRDKRYIINKKIDELEKQLDDLKVQREDANSSVVRELWVVYPVGTTVLYDCDTSYKGRGVVHSIVDYQTLLVLDERGCLLPVELRALKRIVRNVKD